MGAIDGRRRVLVARVRTSGIPRREKTYAKNSDSMWKRFRSRRAASVDAKALQAALKDDVAAVVVAIAELFGDHRNRLRLLAEATHASGECWWLELPRAFARAGSPPVEADIVAMEAQSFGLAPSLRRPFAGVIASRDKFVRQMRGGSQDKPPTRKADGVRADAGTREHTSGARRPPRISAQTRRFARWPLPCT